MQTCILHLKFRVWTFLAAAAKHSIFQLYKLKSSKSQEVYQRKEKGTLVYIRKSMYRVTSYTWPYVSGTLENVTCQVYTFVFFRLPEKHGHVYLVGLNFVLKKNTYIKLRINTSQSTLLLG